MTFTVRTDRTLIRPTNQSNRFVLAEVTAPAARRERPRAAVNLAFVLDRSGSMGGEKLRLAKEAVELSIGRLHDDDRFAVVVYDDRIDVVVGSTPATAEARRLAVDALRGIEARGSTNLAEGWLRGCQQVADALAAEGVNRCLLLTDGLANQGITDHDELVRHATELRARGVTTTTFGVGNDFDEVLLHDLASAGGGHFYYIANAGAIPDLIASEVGETLEIVARDVVIEVSAPEGVAVEALGPNPVRRHRGTTEVILGDLASEQQVAVVLRLTFPFGQLGSSTGAVIRVIDRDDVLAARTARLTWEYGTDRANDDQPRDPDVDRAVGLVFAARARQEALARNRAGDYDGAKRVVTGTADRIRRYAGKDPVLLQAVSSLEAEEPIVSRMMAAPAMKAAYAASSYALQSRSAEGKARKRAKHEPV